MLNLLKKHMQLNKRRNLNIVRHPFVEGQSPSCYLLEVFLFLDES